jgi:hypothetical protein
MPDYDAFVEKLLDLPLHEKARRFDAMVTATYSRIDDSRDLLAELHPRRTLDIKRRYQGQESWHEADWLSNLMRARNLGEVS